MTYRSMQAIGNGDSESNGIRHDGVIQGTCSIVIYIHFMAYNYVIQTLCAKALKSGFAQHVHGTMVFFPTQCLYLIITGGGTGQRH